MEGVGNCSGTSSLYSAQGTFIRPQYAGLLVRLAASIIDDIILIVLMIVPLVILLFLILGASGNIKAFSGKAILIVPIAVAGSWLYNAYFESSGHMATPGKMACGLRVTDMAGNRITFGRATLRFFMKVIVTDILSLPSNYLGSIYGFMDAIAMYTDGKRQCIHDLVAGTVVIRAR